MYCPARIPTRPYHSARAPASGVFIAGACSFSCFRRGWRVAAVAARRQRRLLTIAPLHSRKHDLTAVGSRLAGIGAAEWEDEQQERGAAGQAHRLGPGHLAIPAICLARSAQGAQIIERNAVTRLEGGRYGQAGQRAQHIAVVQVGASLLAVALSVTAHWDACSTNQTRHEHHMPLSAST